MSSPSDYDRHHIGEILAASPSPKDFDWFSAHLIRLIAKADPSNRERIRAAFPEHVAAFEDWKYQRGPYSPKPAAPA